MCSVPVYVRSMCVTCLCVHPCARKLHTLVHANCIPLCTQTAYPCARKLHTLVHANCTPLCTQTAHPCAFKLHTLVHSNYIPTNAHWSAHIPCNPHLHTHMYTDTFLTLIMACLKQVFTSMVETRNSSTF